MGRAHAIAQKSEDNLMFSNGDWVVVSKLLSDNEFESHGLLVAAANPKQYANRMLNAHGMVINHVPRFEGYFTVRQGTTVGVYHLTELKLRRAAGTGRPTK